MLITRFILILLGFWVFRVLLGAWTRSRGRREAPAEPQERGPGEPIPFDGTNIRDAEFEDLQVDENPQGRGAGQGRQ